LDREKNLRKGLRSQMGWRLAERLMSDHGAKTRVVETAHGPVRVLEFGFGNPAVTPLYADFHGGGYVVQSPKPGSAFCAALAKQAGIRVVSVDYPLAPQAPHPAQIESTYEVLRWYLKHADGLRINPRRVGVGGQSAGGNLAAVICLTAAMRGDFSPRLQVLNNPWLDLSADYFARRNPFTSLLSNRTLHMLNVCYIGDDPLLARNPLVSPVYAPPELLAKTPPALILAAGRDSLRGEALRYGELLRAAGVPAEAREYPGMPHGFTTFTFLRGAREANAAMGRFIVEGL